MGALLRKMGVAYAYDEATRKHTSLHVKFLCILCSILASHLLYSQGLAVDNV